MEDFITIPLGSRKHPGHVTLIDPEDADLVASYHWILKFDSKRSWYAFAWEKETHKRIMLHRLILDAPANLIVDHINGNGLDNRRANLRLVTRAQNSQNMRPRITNTASKYKGVWKSGNAWRARIRVNGTKHALGTFATEEEAARAYDDAVRRLTPTHGVLNFPDG